MQATCAYGPHSSEMNMLGTVMLWQRTVSILLDPDCRMATDYRLPAAVDTLVLFPETAQIPCDMRVGSELSMGGGMSSGRSKKCS